MGDGIFDTDFIAISVPVFQRISGLLQFDVYIRRAANTYTKIFPKGEAIDRQRLDSYNQTKGVESFFVHQEDYKKYLLYVEQVANDLFQHPKKTSTEDLTSVVKEMTDLTMYEVVTQLRVDADTVRYATETVKGCVAVLAKDPIAFAKIFNLMTRHPYMLKHSLATSIYALLLGKTEKLEADKSMVTLGLGGMLHDLGMTQLAFDAETKSELNAQEWKEVKEHPQIGKRLLDPVKLVSPEIRAIVLQHHEQPNGRGYPNGLHNNDIFYLAKLVSIADSFAAMVSIRPYREAISPLKALEMMNEDRGKFEPEMLRNFSKLFIGIKP